MLRIYLGLASKTPFQVLSPTRFKDKVNQLGIAKIDEVLRAKKDRVRNYKFPLLVKEFLRIT